MAIDSRSDAARQAARAARERMDAKAAKLAEEKRRRRRRFLLGSVAFAGVGIAGLSGYSLLESGRPKGKTDPFVAGSYGFTYFAGAQQDKAWFKPLVGEPVRTVDFSNNQGALAKWDGVPVLKPCWIICLDPSAAHRIPDGQGGELTETGFKAPPGAQVVHHSGRIFVAFYGGCVHACCVPGWHEAYPSLDAFHCTCHNSRYSPWSIEKDVDERGVAYLGAKLLQPAAKRTLPYVPLELVGDRLHGILSEENRNWYRYCGIKND